MKADIFAFWAEAKLTDKVHPRDAGVLERVEHGFDLSCLPGCFNGPLRTAPVVLLYLSPGLDDETREEGASEAGGRRCGEIRLGNKPLPTEDEHSGEWKWVRSRTDAFCLPYEVIRRNVAVLNIGAYHSQQFTDTPLLSALPSSRASLDWAQEVLFPSAISGERVVVCLRSRRFWGLDKSWKHGVSLFAPQVTRGGHIRHGPEREEIVRAVQAALSPR